MAMMFGRGVSVANHSGIPDDDSLMIMTCERPVGKPEGEIRYTLNAKFYRQFRQCQVGEDILSAFGAALQKMAIIMDAIQLLALMGKPEVAQSLTHRLNSSVAELQTNMANTLSEEFGYKDKDEFRGILTKFLSSIAKAGDV